MTLDRRDLVKVAAGGTFGLFLSPVPWKLLDDTANWSQNWSWTPKLPQGEMTARFSTCTLCPAACGVKAQCVAGRAVTTAGVPAHPFSKGALCPLGLGGHTAAYHSERVRRPIERGATMAEVAARIAKGARVAILDLGPERAVSALYRQAATSLGEASCLCAGDRSESTLNATAELLGREPGTLGLDLEHTRTLVSFGAPILENWAVPGRVMERWRSGQLNILQVDPRQSRTALAAHQWIPTLALDLPAASHIEAPAVAIGSGSDPVAERSIAAMNLTLGAVGREGGILPRSPLPWKPHATRGIASLPDHSIDVLFLDSSRAFDVTPWPVIGRKLASGALVVALAYREEALTAHAQLVLPVAAPFESVEDAVTPPYSAVPAYSLSLPLIDTTQPSGLDHLNAILKAAGKSPVETRPEDEMKQRVAALHAAKKGAVVSYSDGAATRVTDIASAADLWKKMSEGACWVGDPSAEKLQAKQASPPPVVAPATTAADRRPLTLLVDDRPDETFPLMSKLYQESGLFTPAKLARLNPQTAASLGLATGATIVIETAYGEAKRELLVDPAVMPGIVEAAAGIADICTAGAPGNWRAVAAAVRKS